MRYMFLIYDDEDQWEAAPEAEKAQVIGAHMAYRAALEGAGALVYGAPLEHSSSSARVRGGMVEDGPFTDSKEQIGGFYVIEAADLDTALDWASRCPAAEYGRIEVRPVWNIPA